VCYFRFHKLGSEGKSCCTTTHLLERLSEVVRSVSIVVHAQPWHLLLLHVLYHVLLGAGNTYTHTNKLAGIGLKYYKYQQNSHVPIKYYLHQICHTTSKKIIIKNKKKKKRTGLAQYPAHARDSLTLAM